MLKTKHVLSALCMTVAMTMATSAFAQSGIFTVSNSIEPRARANGFTEPAGDISLTLANATLAPAEDTNNGIGTLTIEYGAPITTGTGNTIAVTGSVGSCFATEDVLEMSTQGSTLTVTIEAESACAEDQSIRVSNVLLGIAGSGADSVTATISVSGGFQLSGAREVTVISSVVDELTNAGFSTGSRQAGKVTLIRHTGKDEDGANAQFTLHIDENAVDSFDMAELNLDFSGIPAGATITLDAWAYQKSNAAGLPNSPRLGDRTAYVPDDDDTSAVDEETAPMGNDEVSISPVTVNSEDSDAVVSMELYGADGETPLQFDNDADATNNEVDGWGTYVGGALNNRAIDRITVRGTIVFDAGRPGAKSSLPLDDVNIQVTADVGPTGVATPRGGSAYRGIPRFASDKSHAVTVIDITSDQTMLVVPYALADGVFDTGFAVSNMNLEDDQAGTVTFRLFQAGGMVGEYETDDQLQAGATLAVLLSDIKDEAMMDGDPADIGAFQGYVEIITDFTGADGIAYISDWAAFSATATLSVKEE